MPRTKTNGEKVDQVVFIVYESQAQEWAKALSYVGYNNEKRKAKFLWRLVRAGMKYYQERESTEMEELKQGAKIAADKIAASANRTPIKVDHTNSDGQIDLEEAIEETAKETTLDEEIVETEQFAADEPLAIPPWLDRKNPYKDWSEVELFDKIAELEAIERNTSQDVELKALNRELDSRTQ